MKKIEIEMPKKLSAKKPSGFGKFCGAFLGCVLGSVFLIGLFSATIDTYFGNDCATNSRTINSANAATVQTFDVVVPEETVNSYGNAKIVVIVDKKTGVEYIVYREKLIDQITTSITPRLNADGKPFVLEK